MKKIIFNAIASFMFLLTMVCITQCTKEAALLGISEKEISERGGLEFLFSGGVKSFAVKCDVKWTVSSDNSWLTVSPASGSKNGTVTVRATANTSESRRSATVTVKAGRLSESVSVWQEEAITHGTISFWVAEDFGCGNISVTISGYGTETIFMYHSGEPPCGRAGTATFGNLPLGNYSYTALCGGGRSWSGSVYLDGSCKLVRLNK